MVHANQPSLIGPLIGAHLYQLIFPRRTQGTWHSSGSQLRKIDRQILIRFTAAASEWCYSPKGEIVSNFLIFCGEILQVTVAVLRRKWVSPLPLPPPSRSACDEKNTSLKINVNFYQLKVDTDCARLKAQQLLDVFVPTLYPCSFGSARFEMNNRFVSSDLLHEF